MAGVFVVVVVVADDDAAEYLAGPHLLYVRQIIVFSCFISSKDYSITSYVH